MSFFPSDPSAIDTERQSHTPSGLPRDVALFILRAAARGAFAGRGGPNNLRTRTGSNEIIGKARAMQFSAIGGCWLFALGATRGRANFASFVRWPAGSWRDGRVVGRCFSSGRIDDAYVNATQ